MVWIPKECEIFHHVYLCDAGHYAPRNTLDAAELCECELPLQHKYTIYLVNGIPLSQFYLEPLPALMSIQGTEANIHRQQYKIVGGEDNPVGIYAFTDIVYPPLWLAKHLGIPNQFIPKHLLTE